MSPGIRNDIIWRKTKSYLLWCALAVAVVLFCFPFYWLFISAFKEPGQIFQLPPVLIPWPPAGGNFVDVFQQTPLLSSFFNSVVIAAGNVFLTLLVCSMAGYAFAKFHQAPGNRALFLIVLGTMMIPQAVTLIPVFKLLSGMRLINTYWALILPGAASAFGVFWLRQYILTNVPTDLMEAARIDGCGEFSIYLRIILPLCKAPLAALGIMALLNSWNNLMVAFVVLRTEDMYTLPLLIFMLQGEFRTPYGMLMAAGLLTTLPLIIGFLMFQRSFIAGVTTGAVKG